MDPERPSTKQERRSEKKAKQRAEAYAAETALKESKFEQELHELQERINYRFRNKELLIQAMTRSGFGIKFHRGKGAHNHQLEVEGNTILNNRVDAWISRRNLESLARSKRLSDFLKSNLYLSRRALEMGLDQCVRIDFSAARVQSAEGRIRLTADALEALIAAVRRDASQADFDTFFQSYILPDASIPETLMHDIDSFAGEDVTEVMAALQRMTSGTVHMELRPWKNSVVPSIHADGVEPMLGRSDFGPPSADRAFNLGFAFLQKYPTFFWGFEGDASLLMPRRSDIGYGKPVEDQSNYVDTTPVTYDATSKFREEDSWDAIDIPAIRPESTAERGPYIDKLRLLLADRSLEVRQTQGKKDSNPQFAFYVNGVFEFVVNDRKNLNDAASAFIRHLHGEG